MNDSYSVIRAIRGPITLITLGVLFVLQNFTRYGFDQTWPVLLIVFGLLSLMQRGTAPPPVPPPAPPPRNFPPAGFPQSPGYSPTPGYSQSPYAQPPAGASKGGFGTSAPPRPDAPPATTPTETTPSSTTPTEGGSV